MSFFFDTVATPLWFIVFIFFSATPLWLKWYTKYFKKLILTGELKRKLFRVKSDSEMKSDVLKKATQHWNENSGLADFSDCAGKKKSTKKYIDPVRKNNIKIVLEILSKSGETGVLSKTISDKTSISSLDTTSALTYLSGKKYAEVLNSHSGKKYYLTDLGRRCCINKQIK